MPDQVQPKWTEIEHLPEWDEEFYEVYTAKKHGKWLMLKTLRPEFRDKEEYRRMIEKEFDVRYNLAHPHIVMINDFEDVPGLGMCIITDDVYGESLAKLMREGKVDADILRKVVTQLVEAMDYIQSNHIIHYPITADRIIFTDRIHNLKVIDVGFDQGNHLPPNDTQEDIYNFGVILNDLLDRLPADGNTDQLRKVAHRCMDPDPRRRFRDIQNLKMALTNRSNNRLYFIIIVFLSLMIVLLAWLNSSKAPVMEPDVEVPQHEVSQ